MRPRGQTPRMQASYIITLLRQGCFNEAAGADPADALEPGALVLADLLLASMRPRGQTPRMLPQLERALGGAVPASMRPRGQTPRMRPPPSRRPAASAGFNEAAGADPADARCAFRRGRTWGPAGFNEAAGADPADAPPRADLKRAGFMASMRPRGQTPRMPCRMPNTIDIENNASMRPRGQTPRMHRHSESQVRRGNVASMRPRGQTPRMRHARRRRGLQPGRFNEAAGADPADAAPPWPRLRAGRTLQ